MGKDTISCLTGPGTEVQLDPGTRAGKPRKPQWGQDHLLSLNPSASCFIPLVELGVEPAGLCARCPRVAVPLRQLEFSACTSPTDLHARSKWPHNLRGQHPLSTVFGLSSGFLGQNKRMMRLSHSRKRRMGREEERKRIVHSF